jgi:hypothetical protein
MTSSALLLNRFSSAEYAHERKLLLRLSINDNSLAEGGRDANPVQPYSRGKCAIPQLFAYLHATGVGIKLLTLYYCMRLIYLWIQHCMFVLCSVNDNILHIYFPSRTCVTISRSCLFGLLS